MNGSEWFAEKGGQNFVIQYKYKRTIFSGESRFQKIDILDTEEYGRMLFLDGVAQSSQRDRFIYHEVMVHPALLSHKKPEKICVIGGAEGATLKEIFKHSSVSRVVMIDIDEELVRLCREYMPEWSDGAFEDPRLELRFDDGRKYLEETDEVFDIILVDLSDPVPDSPAIFLFTREFYRTISEKLSTDGFACIQGESLRPWRVEMHARMVNTLKSIFPHVAGYPYPLPCFHELHAQILASKEADPRTIDLGKRMKERELSLEYLSADFLAGLFRVPAYVEKAYEIYDEILTDEQPLIMKGMSSSG